MVEMRSSMRIDTVPELLGGALHEVSRIVRVLYISERLSIEQESMRCSKMTVAILVQAPGSRASSCISSSHDGLLASARH